MRIAFVVNHLDIGGLEKVTVRVANELSNYYEVHLIILGKDNRNYEVSDKIKIYEGQINYSLFYRIRRKVMRVYSRKFARGCYKEIKYLREILQNQKYDKVIACDGGNAMLINKVIVQNKLNTQLVTWLHNNYNTYFNNYYKSFQSELAEVLSASSNVIALTKQDQKDYSRWNKQTTYIYNPLTICQGEISNLTKKEILFVARLVKEHKGLDHLVEIGKGLKGSDWSIRILGDGPDREWFEGQINQYELSDTFILEGSVKKGIEKYYEEASIFISTSKWEGLPLVMIEAISRGLPIISFNHSGAIEILGENEFGIIVEMGNINDFCAKLRVLMDSYEARKKWGEKSLERAKDFSIQSIAKQWKEIIES